MSIRKKIFLGCTIIAVILFLAGVAIIFEMKRIRSSVSTVLSENVKTMNTAHSMQRLIDRQNMVLFNYASVDNDSILAVLRTDIATYEQAYMDAKSSITIEGEKKIIDSINAYYVNYSNIVRTLTESNMKLDRRVMYSKYYPLLYDNYIKMSETINQLFILNQKAVEENSLLMNQNYYRMIMPAIISIVAGIGLIFLFYYFINIYIIKPTKKISDGINAFVATRVPYNIDIETQDEMAEINNELKKLIELTKKYENESKL